MTDSLAGRFTERRMREALGHIAAQLGFDAGDARLLRLTNNAVYALPRDRVVVRITRSQALRDRVVRTVRLAEWFERVDAPTIRLAAIANQPIEVLGMLATIWNYIAPAAPSTVEDLGTGTALREFQCLGKPDVELPRWNPVADVRARLTDAEGLSDNDHAFLLDWCDRLAPRITEIVTRRPAGFIHGDAHPGNLILRLRSTSMAPSGQLRSRWA